LLSIAIFDGVLILASAVDLATSQLAAGEVYTRSRVLCGEPIDCGLVVVGIGNVV